MEIGNALSKRRYRQAAIELLNALEQDPQVEIVFISDELFRQSFEMFSNRPDKDWGLIDCLSFIVMQERDLTEALATDEHFEQPGFSLLRLCCINYSFVFKILENIKARKLLFWRYFGIH